MPAALSTHVLDTARGTPAGRLEVVLYRIEGEERRVLAKAVTDSEGRVSAPLGGALEPGWYELAFAAGAYFASRSEPTFYGEIAVRFRIEAGTAKYHVPLLLSPWGYSTYRGS